ncbi:hypothetical protein [Nonomuraea sp. NPDC050540]|uniref:hypothetical protein n=1 Tax=Nonomuraea sp. NPDC050540 TaxID=3364367 RepID=UPI0037B0914B
MATSPPPADPARRGRLAGRVLLVLTLVLVVVGVLWFFLADPLDLPERTLEALAQRASVISMQAALVFGSIGWWLQRRSAAAGEPGVPSVSTSGENAPAVGTMSGGLVAGALRGPVSTGERAPAISGDVQTLITGDLQEARRPPLPPPSSVADPSGLLGLPRRRAAWFVGRQEAWQELAITLESGTGAGVISQAVVGLGGIGKSELALQYAFARRLDYDLVWWIDADSPAQIKVGLAGLARALVAGTDSVAAGQASPEEAVAWAITWLAGRTGWLLVFDNVEEPAHLEPYLARLTIGQVLITSLGRCRRRRAGSQRSPGPTCLLQSHHPDHPPHRPDRHERRPRRRRPREREHPPAHPSSHLAPDERRTARPVPPIWSTNFRATDLADRADDDDVLPELTSAERLA